MLGHEQIVTGSTVCLALMLEHGWLYVCMRQFDATN